MKAWRTGREREAGQEEEKSDGESGMKRMEKRESKWRGKEVKRGRVEVEEGGKGRRKYNMETVYGNMGEDFNERNNLFLI